MPVSDKRTIQPLSHRLRPKSLKDIVGQESILQKVSLWVEKKYLPSLIFWGPPGCGKTTLAPLVAKELRYSYKGISAIFSGVSDLKKMFEEAKKNHSLTGEPTVLFLDEIHRFNKAQQDAFLPAIELGFIILIGATTENPSFALNKALLSRCQVLTFNALSEKHLKTIAHRALFSSELTYTLDSDALDYIVQISQGDARYLIQSLEILNSQEFTSSSNSLSLKSIRDILTKRASIYDKKSDEHYNLISALHKSIRASNIDASLYWLARMLCGGEDPLYILRRLIRISMEDIGLAAPQALSVALDCTRAYEKLGSPEGDIALTQCVVYLASCPKSNSLEIAHETAHSIGEKTSHMPPPINLINTPSKMMKEMGFGKGYTYDPSIASGVSNQPLWPDKLDPKEIYKAGTWGFENTILSRIKEIEERRKKSLFSKNS